MAVRRKKKRSPPATFTVFWLDEGLRGRTKQHAEVVHSSMEAGQWVSYEDVKGMLSRAEGDKLSPEDGAVFDYYGEMEPWEHVHLVQELRKWIFRVEREYKR